MIKADIKGLKELKMKANSWLKGVERQATQTARGLAAAQLATLVQNSPQYRGDFAANWKLSINKIDTSYEEDVVPYVSGKIPYEQFSPQAISIGLFNNIGKDGQFKLGDRIYITNHSTHDGDPYYQRILDGTMLLRDVNTKVTIEAAMSRYLHKYTGILGKNKVRVLRSLRAGTYWS